MFEHATIISPINKLFMNTQLLCPVFIFSLPRSGSTLLQRLLLNHETIRSVSEPWILLPLLSMTKSKSEIYAEYQHKRAVKAIQEFVGRMPGGEDEYFELLRNFILTLYQRVCPPGGAFFIDKTPRYYLIIPEILRLFPDAKCIFLFRHPLDIYASIMTTWGNGTFDMANSYIDLYRGARLLTQGYNKYSSRSLRVQYETLVRYPEGELERIFRYLGIASNGEGNTDVSSLEPSLNGIMGDKTGIKKYTTVSDASIGTWKTVFASRFRKYVARLYLNELGDNVLEHFGVNLSEALSELDAISGQAPATHWRDLYYFYSGKIYRAIGGKKILKRFRKGVSSRDKFYTIN